MVHFLIQERFQEMDHNNQDTKMYITELKEHVILKERDDGGMVETDEIVEATEYDETVQHLIIDGQVQEGVCGLGVFTLGRGKKVDLWVFGKNLVALESTA